jgi:hypothetical protein
LRGCADLSGFAAFAGLLSSNTIPASGNFTSGVIPADGFANFAAGITSSQNGQLSIQRYMDTAGNIAQGSPLSVSLTAATAASLNNNDTLIFRSFVLKVTNTGGSAATISGFALLLMA